MSICWLFFDEIDSLFLDQCARLIVFWTTFLQTHGIGLTVVFFLSISLIKENHCNIAGYGMVWYGIVKNLCDCVRETMRVWRGSAMVLL